MTVESAVPTVSAQPVPDPAVAPDVCARPFVGGAGRLFAGAAVIIVIAGIVLRFVTKSPMWEDEALSVAIARRPLGELHGLLRHDGAPPLYYVLLHLWMKIFGTGNLGARSLSGLFGVVSLPVAWLVARRVAGPDRARSQWVGWSAVLVLATSPFAIRYSTEARMYALAALLVLVGYLAVASALERRSLGSPAGVAVVTALLLYTHYWSLYVVLVVCVALVVYAARAGRWRAARRVLVAIGVGGLAFAPWVPTLIYQSRHTGTPWAVKASPPTAVFRLLRELAGPRTVATYVLVTILVALVALALFGAAVDRSHTDLDWRTRPAARGPAWVAGATVLVGVTLAYAGIGAAASRYSMIVFGLFVVVVAYGVAAFGNRGLRYAALALLVACGFVGGVKNVTVHRTQADQIARVINAQARPGDVVVYCPDHLGLDVSRLARSGLRQYQFPTLDPPEIINWVDYEQRNRVFHRPGVAGNLADPVPFATEIARRTGTDSTLWYVYANGYKTFGDKCASLIDHFKQGWPDARALVNPNPDIFENMGLYRYRR